MTAPASISVAPSHPPAAASGEIACGLHGLGLRVRALPPVLAALGARLAAFPAPRAASRWLDFEFFEEADPRSRLVVRPTGTARRVMELAGGLVDYFEAEQLLHLDFPGRGRALVDLEARRVVATHPDLSERSVWAASHPLFTIPLAELLKREGLFMLHAAGLARGERALLITGASGAGKTTLTLALLRAGYGFLADDTVLLSARGGADGPGLRALAFPDEMDLTEQTTKFFPDLPLGGLVWTPQGRPKQAVSAHAVFGRPPVWNCEPVALIFPQPGAAHQSRLSRLAPDEALLQVLCNVLRTRADATQAQLDALALLVNQCVCLRLETGRDFDTLPDLLGDVLEGKWPLPS